MPIHDYRCQACGAEFETLVRGGATPACPHCASTLLDRLLSRIAPHGRSAGIIASGRRAANKEGHFSHYSSSERAKAAK
jgi:putative FmdB family regulatory protein